MHPGRLLLIAVFVATWWFAPSAFAESAMPVAHDTSECYATAVDTEDDAEPKLTENSCCDGNGGVCGCSAFGPVMCCDGRLSPTCLCRDGSPVTTLASSTSR
jgi:hypothetical protein